MPPAEIRQLRDYTRTRVDLTQDRTRHWQRLEKLLSEAPLGADLLPASLLRQVRPGQALLVHNTLPPAHLHGRYWFLDPALHELATGQRHSRRRLARQAAARAA